MSKRARRKTPPRPEPVGGVVVDVLPRETVALAPAWWTVERMLYAGIALLAGVVRFLWLGTRPLSPTEAHQAWLAWANTQPGMHVPVTAVNPLAYSLQWLLFLVGGGNDALARFWSALAGVVLVLLPYGLREHIGRGRALLAALLLALSAQGVYWSRHASGLSLTLLAGLGLLVALLAWLDADEDQAPSRLIGVAVLAAALVATGAGAYTILLGLALGLWPLRKRLAQQWHRVGGPCRRRAAVAFGLTLLLGGSAWLTDIPALASVADGLGAWVRGFWESAGYPWYWAIFRLAADEPLLMAFGLWGAWRAWRRRTSLDRVWLSWAGVGLLLALVRVGRTSQDVALLVVPLAFLAAEGLYAAWERLREPSPTWREEAVLTGAYFVILAFWFMMIAGYLQVGDERYIPAVLVVPLLLLGLTLLYRFWLSPEAAWRVVLVSALITLGLWTWMAMWVQNLHLAEDAALDALPGIERRVTHPNIRLLVQTLERISAQTYTDRYEMPVDLLAPADGEVLRWYLRVFKNLRVLRSVKAASAPAVITPADVTPPPGYTGMDWTIGVTRLPTELGGLVYHWWLYREAPSTNEGTRVILWYRPPEAGS